MILAFDTATDQLTIAVGSARQIAAFYHQPAPRAHLGRLVPMIDSVLTEAKVELNDLTHLAVGIGPGSFTGLRIAVATAQGLAHALNIPLIGLATIDIMAAGVVKPVEQQVWPLIDAKRKEVYTAGFAGHRLTDYRAVDPGALAQELAEAQTPVVLVGDALDKYEEVFRVRLGRLATIAPRDKWPPDAQVLIKLAEEKINQGPVEPFYKVLPNYIRMPDAKEKSTREKSS